MLDLTAIDGILVEEADRMDEELLANKLYVSPWVELVDVDVWPEGMGNAISQVVYQPTRYTSLSWTDVNVDTNPIPTASTVSTAQDVKEYKLQHAALQSDPIHLIDLRSAAAAEAQLGATVDNLNFNTHRLLEERSRAEYSRVAQIQVVADSDTAPSEGTVVSGYATMPVAAATLELSNSFLGKYRQRILRSGGGYRALDKVDNAPVFGLICDSETSEALKAELGENLRFSGRATELLSPFGCDGVYKNFFHIIDDLKPRYTWSGSAYVEVAPEVGAAAGAGTKSIPNVLYETAPFTDTYIFHQDVVKLKVPTPAVGRQSHGVAYDAKNYRGEWSWINVRNMDTTAAAYNPDKSWGIFRGVINQATQARKTLLGVVIRHYRPGFKP